MAKLTSRALASGATLDDLIHIVITGDTSQDPLGSSYKATLGQAGNAVGAYETYTAVTVSSAQILSSYSSPVELLSSPGVNNYYDAKYVMEYTFNTTGYLGGAILISDSAFTQNYTCGVFSTLTGDGVSIVSSTFNSTVIRPNSPIYFSTTGSDPTTGDGTIIFKIWYTIRTFG